MKKPIEELREVVEELKEFLLIVEGKRDATALKTLGLRNMVVINRRPLLKVVEEIKTRMDKGHKGLGVVILTDFDREGKRIAGRLRTLLQRERIHPNSRLRRKVMEFRKGKIEDFEGAFIIEGTGKRLKIRRGDIHGKIGANFNKIYNKGKDKGKGSNREA